MAHDLPEQQAIEQLVAMIRFLRGGFISLMQQHP